MSKTKYTLTPTSPVIQMFTRLETNKCATPIQAHSIALRATENRHNSKQYFVKEMKNGFTYADTKSKKKLERLTNERAENLIAIQNPETVFSSKQATNRLKAFVFILQQLEKQAGTGSGKNRVIKGHTPITIYWHDFVGAGIATRSNNAKTLYWPYLQALQGVSLWGYREKKNSKGQTTATLEDAGIHITNLKPIRGGCTFELSEDAVQVFESYYWLQDWAYQLDIMSFSLLNAIMCRLWQGRACIDGDGCIHCSFDWLLLSTGLKEPADYAEPDRHLLRPLKEAVKQIRAFGESDGLSLQLVKVQNDDSTLIEAMEKGNIELQVTPSGALLKWLEDQKKANERERRKRFNQFQKAKRLKREQKTKAG